MVQRYTCHPLRVHVIVPEGDHLNNVEIQMLLIYLLIIFDIGDVHLVPHFKIIS